ncbi:prolipoprotein diacylglyceryl transferase [Atopococcus tabaci]|uniref:prolipoprotein diacylglyceryl transferase n=1 Tax=Atopococcus tabaci TaxID=269774 RepID=UPI0024090A84|nr:prolipoprotein diacylglyceryl transferase [Atopococcus tabaci]
MTSLLGVIDPIAFRLGPLEVRWYGIIIAVGIFVAIWLSSKEAVKRGLDEDAIVDLSLWLIPAGFIGARLYYVLFELGYYLQNPAKIIAIWEGGIAIYGGLIGGTLALIWFCRKNNIPIWLMLDIIAPHVLLAQAIGRWGNFINQEAHGGEVSRQFLENLMLPDFIINQMEIGGTYYHPTFLYESVWSLIGVVLLIVLRNRENLLKRGEVALGYALWYSLGRFFIEGMRTDSLYLFNTPIRVSQLLSVIIFMAAIGLIVYRRKNVYPPVPYYTEGIQPEQNFEKKKNDYYKKKK